jgi:hypothetical protein
MRPDQLRRFAPVPIAALLPEAPKPSVRPRDRVPLPALVTGEPDEATRHGWAKAAAASMVQTDRKPTAGPRIWPWIVFSLVFWVGVALLVTAQPKGSQVQALELRP